MNEFYRGRRLRRNPVIREMVRETQLSAADLMMLYFVVDTTDEDFKKEIPSMPGQYQLSLKQLEKTVGEAVDAGLRSLMLFGIPKHKDAIASEAYAPNGIVQRAIRMLKAKWPDLQVVTDVCLCEYTSHGHCGILKEGDTCGEVVNDPTLELLAKTALSHVEAGADMVAPSDMMDGRILAIRETLDKAGYVNTPIMSYAVKYASAFYGPFRDAAGSAPAFGDRRSYQMDPHNGREAAPHHGDRKTYQMDPANAMEGLREAAADIDEGADIVMVKPAGPYLDVIRMVRDNFDVPVAAYQVSGEYSMIKAAAINGWIDEERIVLESLIGIRRAGAKLILTYYAEEALKKGWVR